MGASGPPFFKARGVAEAEAKMEGMEKTVPAVPRPMILKGEGRGTGAEEEEEEDKVFKGDWIIVVEAKEGGRVKSGERCRLSWLSRDSMGFCEREVALSSSDGEEVEVVEESTVLSGKVEDIVHMGVWTQ